MSSAIVPESCSWAEEKTAREVHDLRCHFQQQSQLLKCREAEVRAPTEAERWVPARSPSPVFQEACQTVSVNLC